MFSFTSILAACFLGVAVSATPLARGTTCTPNFQGVGVSIINGDVEWSFSKLAAGVRLQDDLGQHPPNSSAAWFVQQTGSAAASYAVKPIVNHNLAVEIIGRQVTLQDVDVTGSDDAQIFSINCNWCSSTPSGKIASNCAIENKGLSGCVSLEMGGDGMLVGDCTQTVLNTWDFWAATA